jgi:hypothetical protein
MPDAFKVSSQGGTGHLSFQTGGGLDYEEESPGTKGKHVVGNLSLRCSQIKGIRQPGPPILRDIDYLNDGTQFILRVAKANYTFEAANKNDRADIFGFVYIFCPELN